MNEPLVIKAPIDSVTVTVSIGAWMTRSSFMTPSDFRR